MTHEEIIRYGLTKAGAETEFKGEWDATLLKVADKMFALLGTDADGNVIASLKCEPLKADYLRLHHKEIVPGYYLNKLHWNSIHLDGEISDEMMHEMIDASYLLVFSKLTKKKQAEINEAAQK